MVSILQKEHKILRQVAKEVTISQIGSAKIQKILKNMKKMLASQEDGVAIAAPQIGESLRIFVISSKVLDYLKGEGPSSGETRKSEHHHPDMIFINPKITKLSKEKKFVEEGCLSVRYLYGKVNRSAKAHIEAYDEKGNFFKQGSTGLMAQIFQHETDHLDGILFTDFAKNLKEITPEVIEKRTQKA